ncbi:hypothetical protein MACK_004168 (apicoplast) [Theileria orientalis]|uniref:Uncharacterized protein n=1 Tax=Theileria orientalis TaxID=68886 RepID=A0A976XHE1_THEOR|nr:hypothetical protein MACK_004168 [Theileria orientalis]
MNNCNLIIIKSISIFLIYIYSNFTKTVISIISYLTVKFLIYITAKSVKQIQYENTLFGDSATYIFHFTDKYCMALKYILRHCYAVPLFFLKIFVRYLGPNPVLFSCLITVSNCLSIVISIFSISCTIMKIITKLDLINIVTQYLNKDKFKHMCDLVKTINNIHM